MGMTDRLSEIEARLKAATPGPWKRYEAEWYQQVISNPDPRPEMYKHSDIAERVGARVNAEFIAHAPEDMAYLLDRIKQLEEEVRLLDEEATALEHGRERREKENATLTQRLAEVTAQAERYKAACEAFTAANVLDLLDDREDIPWRTIEIIAEKIRACRAAVSHSQGNN